MDELIKKLKKNKNIRNFRIYKVLSKNTILGTFGKIIGGAYSPLENSSEISGELHIEWNNGNISKININAKALEDPAYIISRAKSIQIKDPYSKEFLKKYSLSNPRNQYSQKVSRIISKDQTKLINEIQKLYDLEENLGINKHILEVDASTGEIELQNSKGLHLKEKVSSYNISSSWKMILSFGISKRKYFEIEDLREDFTFYSKMFKTKDKRLNLTKTDKTDVKVILDPYFCWSLLNSFLFSNLRGSLVANDQSSFKKTDFKNQKKVFADWFTLKINPKKKLTVGATDFTNEGLENKLTEFIKDGKLMTPILDLKHAQKLDMPPTSFITSPNITSFSSKKSYELQNYIKRIDKGIYLPYGLGLHTQNHITGDYSLPCPHAFYIKNGKFTGKTKVIIIGNIFQELKHNLDLVSTNLFPTPGICYNPQVVFE